jgi:hypothetical protein
MVCRGADTKQAMGRISASTWDCHVLSRSGIVQYLLFPSHGIREMTGPWCRIVPCFPTCASHGHHTANGQYAGRVEGTWWLHALTERLR